VLTRSYLKFTQNRFYTILFLSSFILLILNSCSTLKKAEQAASIINLDELVVEPNIIEPYRAAQTRLLDLIHTKLEVNFDWENAHLNGLATLTLKPYFYSANTAVLDAKGFDLNKVQLITDTGNIDLEYLYKDDLISINLGNSYSKLDTFKIFIDYKAKPNELEVEGSSAISDAKGLYFINHTNEDKEKPQQIWTQGETESNSCWFPTIDKPNERMTQELYITVDNRFTTLSNGILQYSSDNGDGTRTDYWSQELPHAPYLVMMAIGEYSIVQDHWRDIEVNYYVEKEYEQYAKSIFGTTPEMLQLYSDMLGVEYPWSKYAQIVVRDYVSGAMENTTAVIHGEFLHKDDRELLDGNNEDIIAHELFHHWFGDLVTCESWSNLPLNESFATYGEYLWNEHKHGRDHADFGLENDLSRYLMSAERKQVDIIRFHYDDKEDMFDSHSYGKGGRVLHMLRKYVGDEAFFASLKLYLNKHKFTSVEIHQLRLAFEEITGEDLNWFFNQWFLSSGHPLLEISYNYVDSIKTAFVKAKQLQDINKFPLYTLPVDIDIYVEGKVVKHKVLFDSVSTTFPFIVPSKPDLINFDAEKMLLCEKKDYKTKDEWIFQYYNAPLYIDRIEAFTQLKNYENDLEAMKVLESAIDDKYWNIRILACQALKTNLTLGNGKIKDKLVSLAKNDKKASVRANAIKQLSIYFHPDTVVNFDKELTSLYKDAISDLSYNVMGQALLALAITDFKSILQKIESFDNKTEKKLLMIVAELYSLYGDESQNTFFKENFKLLSSYDKQTFTELYYAYLLRQDDETIMKGISILEDATTNEKTWWCRLIIIYQIKAIGTTYEEKEQVTLTNIKNLKSNQEMIIEYEEELINLRKYKENVEASLKRIKEQEKNEMVLQYWDWNPK